MEVSNIIGVILICGLVLERLMKHIKKSKCLGNEMEFNNDASVPDLTGLIRK